MARGSDPIKVTLPESLQAQFEALKHRLYRVETLRTLAQVVAVLGFSYLALFVSDRFWNTPRTVRLLITAGGWTLAVLIVLNYIRRWVWSHRTTEEMAVYVQREYQRLGDRLLGIVELADEKKRPEDFSPELYRAAIAQVATEANAFEFPKAVRTDWLRRWSAAAASAILVVVLLAIVLPAATMVSALRWLWPVGKTPRYTLVNIDPAPAERIVPHGEAFEVEAMVNYRSFWKPETLTARVGLQPPVTAKVQDGKARIRLPGQVARESVKLQVGDAQLSFAVVPLHRPSLKALEANVVLPEYLQYPDAKQPVQSGALIALEGSKFSLEGQVTRALTSAVMITNGVSSPLKVAGATFSSPQISVDNITQLGFGWKDEAGLEPLATWPLVIRTTKDNPPVPEFADVPRDFAMLHSENLELKTVGRDDYGVSSVGIRWMPPQEAGSTNGTPDPEELRIDSESPDRRVVEETFSFSPAVMRIPPDSVVEVAAFAVDYYPGRERTESAVYRIHVLGNEQHAEMIRQRLESMAIQLEEISRSQEKLMAETAQLQDSPQLNSQQGEKQIEKLQDQQTKNAQQLEKLAEEGANTLREAVRNPAFQPETLRDWSRNLQQMKNVAQQEMKKASQSLSESKSSLEKRSENLAAAEEQEADALEKLQNLQKQMDKSMDDLQALTLSQRMRKLGDHENELGKGIEKNIAETVGLLPSELPPRYKRVNSGLAEEQGVAHESVKELQDEISRFFERTQKENYGEVHKGMKETKVIEEFERLRGLINENIGMESMQELNRWSTQLVAWAQLIEPPKSDSSGGEGSGGGDSAMSEKMMKQLVALLRLRDSEINLREKTRMVDKDREHEASHQEGSQLLANIQSQLIEIVGQIRTENPLAMVDPPLKLAGDQMEETLSHLAKPETGKPATDSATKAVEALTDAINLINENAKRQNPQQQPQPGEGESEMSFLIQLMAQQQMGMGMVSQGGPNMNGGSTDSVPGAAQGNADGGEGASRTSSRASGTSANTPVEFREALEGYFKALERE